MAFSQKLVTNEVTFVSKDATTMVRMLDQCGGTVDEAAKSFKARYVVMQHEWNVEHRRAIWGVYDMRKVDRNNPTPGAVTLPIPSKMFDHEKADGAVMWAVAQLMKG